jgi:ATP-dependent DNA helicase RecQ
VKGFLKKEVESYGTLKITPEGEAFLLHPTEFMLLREADYSDIDEEDSLIINARDGGGALDEELLGMLKELRKKIAKEKNLPPYVLFQDPSLEEMASTYPITEDELTQINGVGKGKAQKFGADFIALIARYVEDNQIDRPQDMVVKSIVNKSGIKVQIIQNIDKKIPLPDIASSKGLEYEDFLTELEAIVNSGTRIDIAYYINDILDEDSQEEIHDFLLEAESDSFEELLKEFGEDFSEEELRLVRIKFLSEVAN